MSCFIKRVFDIIASALALIILSPLFLFIAIGIKVSSRGSVFYKANRCGMRREQFSMYKFRSMHIVENSVEKSFIADENRIFPFGSFLRKSKLDELPQLINVFFGTMSVVGPRPPSTANVDDLYIKKYSKILDIKPGLTSYASLFDYKHGELFVEDNERYIAEILPVRLDLELFYAETKNIATDFKLILTTIYTIICIILGKKNFKYTKIEKYYIDKNTNINDKCEVTI